MSHKHIYLCHVSNQRLIRCFLLLGGFFKKHARDTSMVKASLGAFPPIIFAPRNAKRKLAVDFNKASRIYFEKKRNTRRKLSRISRAKKFVQH